MAARIVWSENFQRSLDDHIFGIQGCYSRNTLRKLLLGIIKQNEALADNPLKGMTEKVLRGIMFRRVIIKPYFKLIYMVEGEEVIFICIWDTRRDPKQMSRYLTTP